MSEITEALYHFFSGFGLPAYPENQAPAKAALPYITYTLTKPNWIATVPYYARVWYRSQGNEAIDAKVDEIAAAIGEGVSLPTESGAVYLSKGDNFAQMQVFAGDPTLKCAYLSMALMAHIN